MLPPRRPSRKRRTTEVAVAEADALISLPTEILDEILGRLGLRDVVRTSILSRNWRHRWEALPSLDLYFPRTKGNKGAPKGLSAVDGILLRYPGRVRRFYARRLDKIYAGRIHDWIFILFHWGVETLDLSPNFIDDKFALPSYVFSCGRLTSLTLRKCAIPPLPAGFEGFVELKKLNLTHVQLQENGGEDQLENIITTSPSLEALTLWDVDIPGEFTEWLIQAPNLQRVKIVSTEDFGWNFGEFPCLDSAFIDIWNYSGNRNFSKFLTNCASITKLVIYTCHSQINGVLETLPCTFGNLKSLDMYTQFCELHPILSIFYLLRNAPNLETLRILVDDNEEQKFEANGEFQSAQCTVGTCANLQFVMMAGIHWLSNEMSFMELILSKARLLRTLSIRHGEECSMSNEGALRKLLNYKKASSHAKVLFKGKLKGFEPEELDALRLG
uniref:Uncharacterized protein n=1 Tax=Avena sativa TaxID=4498 RepID=A0ACD5XSD3_AVESA